VRVAARRRKVHLAAPEREARKLAVQPLVPDLQRLLFEGEIMRLLNAVVTRVLAAGLALGVWGNVMLHVVKLRRSADARSPNVTLPA
jgi:hypothetical protein